MESFGFLRNGKENPAGRPLLPGGLFDITGGLFDITDDLLIKQKDRTPAKLQASGHQIKRARDGDRTLSPILHLDRIRSVYNCLQRFGERKRLKLLINQGNFSPCKERETGFELYQYRESY